MAFPKLLQKLFTNGGAGDKLRSEILPDMNYLPLAGGTMTGWIKGTPGIVSARTDGKGSVCISAGPSSMYADLPGGMLILEGTQESGAIGTKGGFNLTACDANGLYVLRGTPQGELTWNGQPVVVGSSNTSGAFPVGFIGMYGGTTVPDGWFRCDGSTIADMATNYPKLYAVLGTNVLPNYTGRLPLGATDGINQQVAAGLPNITGSFGRGRTRIESTGAFVTQSVGDTLSNDGSSKDAKTISFDASRCSSIYGNSNTVTPPSVKTVFCIKHD